MAAANKILRLAPSRCRLEHQNLSRTRLIVPALLQQPRTFLPLGTPFFNSARLFSAASQLQVNQKPAKQPPIDPQSTGQNNDSNNPELPAFSLDGLGISKNMKLVIIGILCVFGTMETWMYCKWIWRWWKGEQNAESSTA